MMNHAQKLLRRLFIGSGVTGVYASYAAALAAVPKGRKVGYDNEETSDMYPYLLGFTKVSDFAALFYLNQLAKPGYRIFDFGGNTGFLFYNYQSRWAMPAGLEWTVCDVPAVIEAGRELARTRPSEGLSFTSSFADSTGADMLLTSGTLQYIPETLAELLAKLADPKPRHILANRTALWDGPTFFTLQSIGPVVCPYRVQNRKEFVAELEAQGYRVKDAWDCPESRISVRWRIRHRIKAYAGLLLERE
ncbi:MAG TPA: methyltransferase, TIGR04325 family [Acidobacteriaceae bacterium]|jgi:putative methyltransferase (TIGR04325 family)